MVNRQHGRRPCEVVASRRQDEGAGISGQNVRIGSGTLRREWVLCGDFTLNAGDHRRAFVAGPDPVLDVSEAYTQRPFLRSANMREAKPSAKVSVADSVTANNRCLSTKAMALPGLNQPRLNSMGIVARTAGILVQLCAPNSIAKHILQRLTAFQRADNLV